MPTNVDRYFVYEHLRGLPRQISSCCASLAKHIDRLLPDAAEKSAGMRKLLEAKDCFVRCALDYNSVEAELTPAVVYGVWSLGKCEVLQLFLSEAAANAWVKAHPEYFEAGSVVGSIACGPALSAVIHAASIVADRLLPSDS